MKGYAFYNSKYGFVKIGYDGDCVGLIKLVSEKTGKNEINDFSDKVFCELEEYFEGKRLDFSFKVNPEGTDFQKKVWNALLTIPYGETRSYKDIAQMIGNPKACRAVGGAVHNNPVWIVVPCHRVIGNNGSLTGYAGGLELKEKLLGLERNSYAD